MIRRWWHAFINRTVAKDDGQGDAISHLQAEIEALWSGTGFGGYVRITSRRSDDGSPHVEVRDGLYDIVVTERGVEFNRFPSLALPDAARWFVYGMARDRALRDELRTRQRLAASGVSRGVPGGTMLDDGYSRGNWMAPTIEIMKGISPDFGDWAAQDFQATLAVNPLSKAEVRNARYSFLPGMT